MNEPRRTFSIRTALVVMLGLCVGMALIRASPIFAVGGAVVVGAVLTVPISTLFRLNLLQSNLVAIAIYLVVALVALLVWLRVIA